MATQTRRHRRRALYALFPLALVATIVLSACELDVDYALFGDAVPATASQNDPNAVELGVKFTSSSAGSVTGVRFYKGAKNTGTHTGSLWSSSGTRLASATFTNETASGWQSVTFAKPVPITAGATYTASYFAPKGGYAGNTGYFNGGPATSGPLTATGSTYRYSSTSGYPMSTYGGNNYWVDVNFTTTIHIDPTTTTAKPTTTTAKPATTTTTAKPTTTTTAPPPTTTPITSPGGAVPCELTPAAEACWASHTGVPGWTGAQILAGQSPLQKVVGDMTITTPGTVIDGKWIEGCIAVKANNVTIKNSYIRTQRPCYGGNGQAAGAAINVGNGDTSVPGVVTGLLIQDTEVDGMNASYDSTAIGAANYSCIRCNVHGAVKDFWATRNVTIRDSYVHHPSTNNGSIHSATIDSDSGENITIDHSYVSAKGTRYITAAVQFLASWGAGSDMTINNSYLEGVDGADFATYAASYNIRITNNAFSNNNGWGGTSFVYGYNRNNPGMAWSGNYVPQTGAVLPEPAAP